MWHNIMTFQQVVPNHLIYNVVYSLKILLGGSFHERINLLRLEHFARYQTSPEKIEQFVFGLFTSQNYPSMAIYTL